MCLCQPPGDHPLIGLDAIVTEPASQSRVRPHPRTVEEYAGFMGEQLMDGGLRFPPIVLFTDGRTYWLADGFHRVAAARQANLTTFPAVVQPGSQRDALLYSISANSLHGLPRTHADKRHAVDLLLTDPEWSEWSDREIARRCQVSDRLVNKRRRLSANNSQMRFRKVRRGTSVYKLLTRNPNPEPIRNDRLGLPIRSCVFESFAVLSKVELALQLYTRLEFLLAQIARAPGGVGYLPLLGRQIENGQEQPICLKLRKSRARMLAAMPYCGYCPWCHVRQPGQHQQGCTTCHGRGWTTQEAFANCPEGYQRQILSLRDAARPAASE